MDNVRELNVYYKHHIKNKYAIVRYECEKEKVDSAKQKVICACKMLKTIKSEAIKEFAERLKEKLQWDVEFDNKLVFESDIDNLVKEITEER